MSCKHPTLNDKPSQTLRVSIFTPQSYKNKFTQQIISKKISKKHYTLTHPNSNPLQRITLPSTKDIRRIYER